MALPGFSFLLKVLIYPHWERRGKGEWEREKHWYERETPASSMCPNVQSSLQPGHVPWPGIKPASFRLQNYVSTNWATPAMTVLQVWRCLKSNSLYQSRVTYLTFNTHLFIHLLYGLDVKITGYNVNILVIYLLYNN